MNSYLPHSQILTHTPAKTLFSLGSGNLLSLSLALSSSCFSTLIHFEHCRGIKKMKDTLPSKTLKEKLPEFLQQCAKTFELDRRYRNDLRYLRVWLHLVIESNHPCWNFLNLRNEFWEIVIKVWIFSVIVLDFVIRLKLRNNEMFSDFFLRDW